LAEGSLYNPPTHTNQGDYSVATTIVRGDKTGFVKEFLAKNPQGNFKTINEAWTADGMKGTISKSVVDKTRAKLGLTGNLGAKSEVAAKPKPAP
jgi:hypothetical protein